VILKRTVLCGYGYSVTINQPNRDIFELLISEFILKPYKLWFGSTFALNNTILYIVYELVYIVWSRIQIILKYIDKSVIYVTIYILYALVATLKKKHNFVVFCICQIRLKYIFAIIDDFLKFSYSQTVVRGEPKRGGTENKLSHRYIDLNYVNIKLIHYF